jgi:hypothetical protein
MRRAAAVREADRPQAATRVSARREESIYVHDKQRRNGHMGNARRSHLERQKVAAGAKLAARLEELKARGVTGKTAQREAVVRKLQAAIRKANYQLAVITAHERRAADKAQVKKTKAAARASRPKASDDGQKAAPRPKKPKQSAPAAADASGK